MDCKKCGQPLPQMDDERFKICVGCEPEKFLKLRAEVAEKEISLRNHLDARLLKVGQVLDDGSSRKIEG